MFDAKKDLLTPENSTVALIDHQPQMIFGVQSTDRQTVINNTVGLAKTAKAFQVPTVLTTVSAHSFSGPLHPDVQAVFPDQKPIDRSTLNAWEDENFREAIIKTGRKKIVAAALWTDVCLAFPVLSMLKEGYEVYIVTDASASSSVESHNMAIQRMIQAGAIPVDWQSVMFEYQRDWAREETYDKVMEIAEAHTGAFSAGLFYAHTMFNGQEGK